MEVNPREAGFDERRLTRITDHLERGYLSKGKIAGCQTAVIRGGSKAATGEASARLKDFKKAVKAQGSDGGSFITQFLTSADDPRVFYGENLPLNYTISWVLTHYLLHGDDGAHRDAFVNYIKAEARGQGGHEAFYREMGLEPAALDAAVTAHVKKMRVR